MNKRFVSIASWCKANNGNYKTVKHALETGQIHGIKTESGQWLVDTQADANLDFRKLFDRLEAQEKLLKSLCHHLGAKAV